MKQYHGDQGPYGHERRKPTTWASTRPLPLLKRGPGTGQPSAEQPEEVWQSARWAKWAPGMIQMLVEMLQATSKCELRKAEVSWEEHIKNGHWPPSRRCRTCIAAGARQRPHRRVESPASWVLAADTIGPFRKAEDETSSGLRYIVVACLLVPIDNKGRPVLGPEQEQAIDESAPEPTNRLPKPKPKQKLNLMSLESQRMRTSGTNYLTQIMKMSCSHPRKRKGQQ